MSSGAVRPGRWPRQAPQARQGRSATSRHNVPPPRSVSARANAKGYQQQRAQKKEVPVTDFAISALTRKRAELAGEIQVAEVRLRELRANLAHVDATIRLFSPDYPIAHIAPKKPQPE